ncbi:MAG: type I DNA topoisomerase [Deltaproteobacteria bacterium]|jgi:DNA topoisomerase-1|nr:type I DNA topoisomerase [Deltaproteobacteria bacterium]
MTKLLIVESPGKIKTIKKYLGDGWDVQASFGHVRDLPIYDIGVNFNSFQPTYKATERGSKRLKELKPIAAQSEAVYLATDPDREGEAIAWHLKDALKLPNPKRITFSEITESAVKKAVASPGEIDMKLVYAQEARRVLDRLVGYPASSALGNVLGKGNSAGRVQSPALKIVVDRERAIKNFKATTHYGVEFTFEAVEHIATGWKATWLPNNFFTEGSEYILDKSLADKVAKLKTFVVQDFKDGESQVAPKAPFTTSTLQQAASQKLMFSPKKTMQLAQRLYEDGHITYMRTDSPNLSVEAIALIQEFCRANNLPAASQPRTFKVKAGSQAAHEAIRPTYIEVETAGETDEHQALYNLIRLRALASQMEDAVFFVRKAELEAEESIDGQAVKLTATGRTLKSPGWQTVYQDDDPDDEESGLASNPIPDLRLSSRLNAQGGTVQKKQTKPPTRFTEASLVKQMENLGIGRPATYAAILDNIIKQKGYLTVDKTRKLIPSDSGCAVVDHLQDVFSFMDLNFTRALEDGLDEIATGKTQYKNLVASAWGKLSAELEQFKKKHGHVCPECGKTLIRFAGTSKKTGKPYDLYRCSDEQACKKAFWTGKDGKPNFEREAV